MADDTMKKFPGLVRRGDRFAYRVRVPKDLVESIGAVEIKVSLHTTDPQVALQAAKKAAFDISERFAEARRRVPLRVPQALLNAPRRWITAPEETYVIDATVHRLLAEDDLQRMSRPSEDAMSVYTGELRDLLDEVSDRLSAGRFGGRLRVKLEDALTAIGVALDPDGEDFQRLGYQFMVALRGALEDISQRFTGTTFPRTPAAPARPTPPKSADAAAVPMAGDAPTLLTILDKWERERKPRGRTRYEYEAFVNEFHEVIGRRAPIAGLTRPDVQKLKEHLIERGLNPRTVAKRVGAVKSLLKFAEDNGLVAENVAAKVTVSLPKTRKQKSRLPFTDDDITALLTSAVWSQGARPAGGAGEAAWWIPILCFATGCRREEIASLKVSQVCRREGVVFLDLTDAEVKTESSRREAPLHRVLIDDLGFMDYVESLPQGTVYLFPALDEDKHGKRGTSFGKWFGRMFRAPREEGGAGINDPRVVLHSTRHWFKDRCRNAGIPKDLHDALTGHAAGDVGSTYGAGFSLKVLDEAVQKIDLGVLKVAGKWVRA